METLDYGHMPVELFNVTTEEEARQEMKERIMGLLREERASTKYRVVVRSPSSCHQAEILINQFSVSVHDLTNPIFHFSANVLYFDNLAEQTLLSEKDIPQTPEITLDDLVFHASVQTRFSGQPHAYLYAGELYRFAFERFKKQGLNIKGIFGFWGKEKPLSDMYETFITTYNAFLSTQSDQNNESLLSHAAWQTWEGAQARELGLSQVIVKKTKKPNKDITALFY